MSARAIYWVFLLASSLNAAFAAWSDRALFCDGSYFLVRIAERASFAFADPFRVAHHALVHGPTILAVRAGVRDWSVLSLLFGLTAFFVPWILIAGTIGYLVRRRQAASALLLVGAHALAVNFIGMFIVSESHLAVAVFFASVALLMAGDLSRSRAHAALLALGAVALLCYEAWSIFAAVCLLALWLRTRSGGQGAPSRASVVGLVLLYAAILLTNCAGIVLSSHTPNRDRMLGSAIENWPYVLVATVVAGMLAATTVPPRASTSHSAASGEEAALLPLWIAWFIPAGAAAGWLAYDSIAPAPHAYSLRSLNLIVSVICASAMLAAARRASRPTATLAMLSCALLGVTSSTQARHTLEWRAFLSATRGELQRHSGYVAVAPLPARSARYACSWTSPALSVVVQAQQRELQTIAFNPAANWQPFGPPLCESLQWADRHFDIDVRPLRQGPACPNAGAHAAAGPQSGAHERGSRPPRP